MNLCDFEVNDISPFFLIAGTCVIESMELAMDTAGFLKETSVSYTHLTLPTKA